MKRLFDAPHRVFFFSAALQILIASAWWAAALFVRAHNGVFPFPQGAEPARVHAFLMIYGFFPLFIFGFLFTAGPRWLGLAPRTRREFTAPGIAAACAATLLLPAFYMGPQAAALVILALLGAWGWMLGHFIVMIRASRAPDRTHAIVAACALGAALVGLAATRIWLLTGSTAPGRAMELIGLWAFLVPMFSTVCHRMIPFFTSSALSAGIAWRPAWTLPLLVGGSLAHGALALAGLDSWTWIVDAPVGMVALLLTWRWDLAATLGNRLLAMLHFGFAWLGLALVLHAAQSLLLLAGVHALGLAPMHALTIGFLSSLALAMVSRVSCGHSGRNVSADRLTWIVFLLLQAAAIARVSADLWLAAYGQLLLAAALLWLTCFAAWSWRYMPY